MLAMPMLEVPGSFTMLVPDGWSATENEGTYELTKTGTDGEVHISVFDRDGSRLGDDEAAELVRQFTEGTIVKPRRGLFGRR